MEYQITEGCFQRNKRGFKLLGEFGIKKDGMITFVCSPQAFEVKIC